MSELSKRVDELRRSLKEARDQQNNAEAMPSRITEVLANLVHVTVAARGEAFQVDRRAYTIKFHPRSTDLGALTEADRAEYRLAQDDLLDAAEKLTGELRAHHFPDATVRQAFFGTPEDGQVSANEKAVALGFEIASYISLRDFEGVARKGLSVAARDTELEAAVKVGQYLMGPSPLTLVNDVTKVIGEAVAGINEQQLQRCVRRVSEAVSRIEALEHPGAQAIASPLKERPSVTPVIESPRRMPPPHPPSRRHPRNEGPSSPRTPGF
ncbi:hypothetical protein [Streptomyces sp. NPDC001139]